MELHKILKNTELFLWKSSQIPLVNCVTGLSKAAMGVVQLISSLAVVIFSAPFLGTKRGKEIFHSSLWYSLNGMGNILSGVVLTIPIIGNFYAYIVIKKDFFVEYPETTLERKKQLRDLSKKRIELDIDLENKLDVLAILADNNKRTIDELQHQKVKTQHQIDETIKQMEQFHCSATTVTI